MNHIFKRVWSKKAGGFVAVSENAKSGGKKSSVVKAAIISAIISISGTSFAENLHFGEGAGADGGDVTGNGHIAIGTGAGADVSGNGHIAIGTGAGTVVSGNDNIAIGTESGTVVEGRGNSALGSNSGNDVGFNIGDGPSFGYGNSVLGSNSGNDVMGDENSVLGSNSGNAIYSDGDGASGNSVLGSNSGNDVQGNQNSVLGWGSGSYIQGDRNNTLGTSSFGGAIGDGNNTIGNDSSNSSYGDNNNIIGNDSGNYLAGSDNVIIGNNSGKGLNDADQPYWPASMSNIIVGNNSGEQIDGYDNTILGNYAGNFVEGSNNSNFGSNSGSYSKGDGNSYIGNYAGVSVIGSGNTFVGDGAGSYDGDSYGNYNTFVGSGAGAGVNGDGNIAIGEGAGYGNGVDSDSQINYSIAIGGNSKADSDGNVAIGQDSYAGGLGSIAIGDYSYVEADNSLVMGNNSYVSLSDVENLNVGYRADGSDIGYKADGVVSIGSELEKRRIINLADGNLDSDAVNVGQLKTVQNNVDGINDRAVVYDGEVGSSKDTITLAGADGTAINNVKNGAINEFSNNAVTGNQLYKTNSALATYFGGGASFNSVTGEFGAPEYIIQGGKYNDVGSAFDAVDSDLTNLHNKVDIGTLGVVQRTGNDNETVLTAAGGTAASPGEAQKLGNLADGKIEAGSKEAVNGGQLNDTNNKVANSGNSVAIHLGGGASYDSSTGTISAPEYTIQGGKYDNVGSAFDAVDNDLTNLHNKVDNGTLGVVQRTGNDNEAVLTAAGGTAANPGEAQKLGNLADGKIESGSKEAINGGQLNDTNNKVANSGNSLAVHLGGGASYDSSTGTISAPEYTIQGGKYDNVGSAFDAVDSDLTNLHNKVDIGTLGVVQRTGNDNETVLTAAGGTAANRGEAQILGNLADGKIEAGSKEAVNGGQINNLGNSIASGMGGDSRFENGQLVTDLNVGGEKFNNVNDAINAAQGFKVTDDAGNTSRVGANGTLTVSGDKNISVVQSGKDNNGHYNVTLSEHLDVKSVTSDEVRVNNGPTINQGGIDMNQKRITNVANGINDTDAVNVHQLNGIRNELRNEIGSVRRDMNRMDRGLRAGVAAAMATASMPQSNIPGKSMVSIGAANWKGEQGIAIGVSKFTEDGKYVFKFSGNASSRGDYGGAVGAGFHF